MCLWVKLHDSDILTVAGEPRFRQIFTANDRNVKNTQQSGMDDKMFPKCLCLFLVSQENYHLQLQCFSTVLSKYL